MELASANLLFIYMYMEMVGRDAKKVADKVTKEVNKQVVEEVRSQISFPHMEIGKSGTAAKCH